MQKYITFFLFLFLAVPTFGQEEKDYSRDTESIDNLIAALYEVISGEKGVARDWDRFTNLFYENAKLIPTRKPADSSPSLVRWSAEDYVNNAGRWLEENGFFEVEISREQEKFGHIAHAFSTYESRRSASDEKPFARGINSIQLFNDQNRWWIVNIFWDSESPASPIPKMYLPKN